MLRRLLTLAAALSLVLCAATCLVWVRSYLVADFMVIRRGHPVEIGVLSQGGMIDVRAGNVDAQTGQFVVEEPFAAFLCPHAVPAAVFAVLPAVWLVRRRPTRGDNGFPVGPPT